MRGKVTVIAFVPPFAPSLGVPLKDLFCPRRVAFHKMEFLVVDKANLVTLHTSNAWGTIASKFLF